MHKVLSAIILLAIAAPSASAQNSPWAQKIFFGVTSHDFGTCPRGAQLKHRFRMKNIYAVPLHITNIRISCGCLSCTPSKKVLQPKEEGYLEIVMDATRFSGHKTVSLYVTVGPTYISTAAFQITANARTDVVFNPGSLDFGVISAGSTPTQVLDVEYAGNHDWRILEVVKSKKAPFTVAPQETFRKSPKLFKDGKVGYQLVVTVQPNASAGFFREELLLKTNDPASPVLTVCVEGNIQAPVTVTPNVVKMGAIKVAEKKTQKVVVRGKQPFRILSVEGAGNGVNVDLPKKQAPYHILNIEYAPTVEGPISRELTFQTNVGQGASVSVTVQANATQ